MTDSRGKDIGTPIIRKSYLPATPETVARTRANFEKALSNLYSEINGFSTKVTVNWGEKPKGYGISDSPPGLAGVAS